MRGIGLPFAAAIALATITSAAVVAGVVRQEVAAPAATGRHPAPSAALTARVSAALARQPVAFVANRGQTDARVRYAAQGSGFAFFATPDEVRLALDRSPAERVALALRFVGHDRAAAITGSDRLAGDANFLGATAATTHTNVPRYGGIVYRGLWPGIDLALREQGGALKYEFRVRPGARPSWPATAASRSPRRSAPSTTPRRSPTRRSAAPACGWRAATTSHPRVRTASGSAPTAAIASS
jgi:hypothetical protein